MSGMGMSVITCTGARPETFALSEHYMRRQTYPGPIQWIVVDDGPRPTPCTMRQVCIRPAPLWKPGENTLARNLRAALQAVRYRAVVMWEDDDYYHPDWLALCARRLSRGFDLVAEPVLRYFHVGVRRYRIMKSVAHGSLCQTAFGERVIPILDTVCQGGALFIDVRLWQRVREDPSLRIQLAEPTFGCVGMKGLPGRAGIGVGHRPSCSGDWISDPQLQMLKSWIGENAELYRKWGGVQHERRPSRVGVGNVSMARTDPLSVS